MEKLTGSLRRKLRGTLGESSQEPVEESLQAPDNGANYRINYRKLMEQLENAHRSNWRQLTEPIGESSTNQSEKHYKINWRKLAGNIGRKVAGTVGENLPEPVRKSSTGNIC